MGKKTSNFKIQNPAVAAPKRRFDAPRRREKLRHPNFKIQSIIAN